ncbi:MAG: cupredoxin family copper-binding protein [Eubacteriaceae bacterium]|nr:cupredoxin family copper-binding protein [Eubacteriaceae bacterium]
MGKNRNIVIILILVALTALISGCSSSMDGQGTPTDKNTVLIQDYKFQPSEITISMGESVTWINKDSVKHTATGDSFDSGLLGKEESFKQTFNEAGTFDYICTPHPYMKGKVIVK